MKYVTLALDEETIEAGREYARLHRTSLNALIRKLLRETVFRQESRGWADEFLVLADSARGNSRDQSWTRQELYEG